MLILAELAVDHAKAQGHVCLGVVFFHLVFELLVQAHSAVTD